MTVQQDFRATFFEQFEAWQQLDMFQTMGRVTENSPWHREASVLVHTRMVVAAYVKSVDAAVDKWSHNDYLGAVACAFHDVGKPAARVEKFNEARGGKYFAYHGHELISARMFEDFASSRYPMFSTSDMYNIAWMIEHHMPWEVQDKDKRRSMALNANMTVGVDVWMRALMADQLGRIADDNETKLARAQEWVDAFRTLAAEVGVLTPYEPGYDTRRVMTFVIAPSGAGKSTLVKQLLEANPATNVFSLDALRHEFYDATDYAKAYQASVDDKSFEARTTAVFHKVSKDTKDIVVDNTNLSAKRRRFYLDVARRQKFKTVAYLLPVGKVVVIQRQASRKDKSVPRTAVTQQYMSLQVPMYGEFDEIHVLDTNIKK